MLSEFKTKSEKKGEKPLFLTTSESQSHDIRHEVWRLKEAQESTQAK